MKKTIQKQEKQDHGFTRALTSEIVHEPKKQTKNIGRKQELTREDRREIARNKREEIAEKKREEMIARNYGFTEYRIYELYRAEMRTAHDIYRKDQMSRVWEHNSLWERSEDTIESEDYDSNRIFFTENTWLKKIGFMDLKDLQNKYHYLNSSQWFDSKLFLADNISIHESGALTACKELILQASMFSQISNKKLYQLKISLFAVNGQYYISHVIQPIEPEEKKQRTVKTGSRMKQRTVSWFDKIHISRSNSQDRIDYLQADLLNYTRPCKRLADKRRKYILQADNYSFNSANTDKFFKPYTVEYEPWRDLELANKQAVIDANNDYEVKFEDIDSDIWSYLES